MTERAPIACTTPDCKGTVDASDAYTGIAHTIVVANRPLTAPKSRVYFLECTEGHLGRYVIDVDTE